MTAVRRRPGRPAEPIPREVLLAAALGVISAHGFGAARLADVARAAGISKGALAYHFPSKEALYLEVLDTVTRGLGELVEQALGGTDPWTTRLDRLGESVVRVLGAQPHVARLILRELTDDGPYLAGPGRERVEWVLERVVAFLDEGVQAGRVAPQDTVQLAGTIVLLHLGWFGAAGLTGALLGGDPAGPDAVEARVAAVVAQVQRLCAG